MTYRPSDPCSKSSHSPRQGNLNQQIKLELMDEGCPVIEESGSVCGEAESLCIFQEFRKVYDDCVRKLEEQNQDGYLTLKKLAPFKKLVENLWEQNNMLVETVEELEQEASCTVTNLQNQLNKSLEKDLHCKLKAKERELERLTKELSEKDDLLTKYCCQIEELRRDMKEKNKKYKNILKQLKSAAWKEYNRVCENKSEESHDESDEANLEELVHSLLKEIEDHRRIQCENSDFQMKTMISENNKLLMEKSEIDTQLQYLTAENEKLVKDIAQQKMCGFEKEELLNTIEQLKTEKNELKQKLNCMHENIQELNSNFKETRWALTAEVAEKHDQVQELRRCVGVLEEQLRQADMQTHFKDDIIKELRKELKGSRKSERLGLYDVVTELKKREKSKTESNSKNNKVYDCDDVSPDSKKSQSGVAFLDCNSFPGPCTSKEKDKLSECAYDYKNENVRLQSQLECLKSTLKLRVEQLREQEEINRDLAEELERVKMDLSTLQEKNELKEHRVKPTGTFSEPFLSSHHKALSCAASKIEQTLKNLSVTHDCGVPSCKVMIEREMENIVSVKKDLKTLKVNKSKNQYLESSNTTFTKEKSEPCGNIETRGRSAYEIHDDNSMSIQISDVESFREKALNGVAALEEMKEQIEIMGKLIRKHGAEYPCDRDKIQVSACEEKFEELRAEFDETTEQLCSMIEKLSKVPAGGSYNESFHSCDFGTQFKEEFNTQSLCQEEDTEELRSESQRLQKDISDLENKSEKLKMLSCQLEQESQGKRNQLAMYSREIDSKLNEIVRLRKLVKEVSCRLTQMFPGNSSYPTARVSDPTPTCLVPTLNTLFSDLQELGCILEKSSEALSENPKKLKEDYEKLKEKLNCLEKCAGNKEETLKVLQDTLKMREYQIEELNLKIQNSETQSFKLSQDIEEKCRLIANLQEAVRKCKQFEVNVRTPQVESLQFEICDLDNKLKKSEKEIRLKDQKLESLHDEIIALSTKNFVLSQEIKIAEPRLKNVYKTCHLFENMVADLQKELRDRECESESLQAKVRELEEELQLECEKCDRRASEDMKCIEELNGALKNLQNEFFCAQGNYHATVTDLEQTLQKEREMNKAKEFDLNNIICNLKENIKTLQNQLAGNDAEEKNLNKIAELECAIRQGERQQQIFNRKISELEKMLECTVSEHDEERKNLLEKLCEEKRENMKNKTAMTKLNENIKRKTMNEKTLKDCIASLTRDNEVLKGEIHDLKMEVEARKKVMGAIECNEMPDLSKLEDLLCHLKTQNAELKSRCCALKDDLEKEVTHKKQLECRVEDLNIMLESKIDEFRQIVENYKCTSSKLQQTLIKIRNIEDNFNGMEYSIIQGLTNGCDPDEYDYLKKLLDAKTAENAKLMSRLEIIKVEMEAAQIENTTMEAKKDSLICSLRHEINCLENNIQELEKKCVKLEEENKIIKEELSGSAEKEAFLQNEYMEKQRELCCKLKSVISEKNTLMNSVDELHQRIKHICLENASKEKMTRALVEECSRLKTNIQENESKELNNNKSDKIICNLNKEVKSLQFENNSLKESYASLNEKYQSLLEQFKCIEKKKLNLEKLYVDGNNENRDLHELRSKYEKELCELQTQNLFLKDKLAAASKGDGFGKSEEKKKMCSKIRELTIKIKSLEKRIIPDLEQEIAEKACCIENLKVELREANISSQRMRNEALRVIQQTKKYLAAQRCANETLKTRLMCSNKRGSILGAENRDLEEQLKAVTRMNEFLLCQLEGSKSDVVEVEPRTYSPLPWGCSVVERDTSSSEYLAESGIQSMQQSPTNMDYGINDFKYDYKRPSPQWNSLKRNKCGGSVEYPSYRNGDR